MVKKGYEQFDYGIYRGQHQDYDIKDKQRNLSTHTRLMLNKSLNMFEYHNLPDTIPEKELERILQTSGYGGIVEVEGELYAVWGGLGGEQDAYYRPTLMTVANPGLKRKNGNSFSETLEIGEDVILMKNDDNMVGLIPIYAKYGTLMNETDLTIYITLINKRAENIISVSDDNTAESARKYLEKLEEGEIGYIQESKLYDSLQTSPTHTQGSGSSYTELTELQQYLKGSMYNEIGLNANYNMKRERLNSNEVEMNSEALYPLVDNMLYNRRLALEEVNEKYGTNIEVEFNSSWDYRLGNHEDTGEVPYEFAQALEDEHAPIDLDKEAPNPPQEDLTGDELDESIDEGITALQSNLEVNKEVEEDNEQGDPKPHIEDTENERPNDKGAKDNSNALEEEREVSEQEEEERERHPQDVDSGDVFEQEIEIHLNGPSEEPDQDTSEAQVQVTTTEENEQVVESDNEASDDDITEVNPVTPDEDESVSDDSYELVTEAEAETEPETVDEDDPEPQDVQKPMNIVRILQTLNPFNSNEN